MGSITAGFAGYFSIQKWKEIKLINFENQSPVQFNFNQLYRDALKDSKDSTVDELSKVNQELTQQNLLYHEIITSLQKNALESGKEIDKLKTIISNSAENLKNAKNSSFILFIACGVTIALLGLAMYKAIKNKRSCIHMKKQIQSLVTGNSKNLDNISKLVAIRAESRKELIETQKQINAQVLKMKEITNWRVDNTLLLKKFEKKIPKNFAALNATALQAEKIRTISYIEKRSNTITSKIDELMTEIRSKAYNEKMKKLPSHVLYSALFASTLYTVFQFGLLPSLQDSFLQGLVNLDSFYVTRESSVLTLGDFADVDIPYRNKKGESCKFTLSRDLGLNHLDYGADSIFLELESRTDFRVFAESRRMQEINLHRTLKR